MYEFDYCCKFMVGFVLREVRLILVFNDLVWLNKNIYIIYNSIIYIYLCKWKLYYIYIYKRKINEYKLLYSII